VTVSEILEERIRLAEAPHGLATGLSIVAHLAFLVFLVLISQPRKLTTPPLLSLPVRVISPGALARLSSPPGARPAPSQARRRPVIEKVRDEAPAPSAEALPLPEKPKKSREARPAPPPPAAAPSTTRAGANAAAVELPSAGNGALGGDGAPGLANYGASVSGFDADFPFAYYAEQIQSLVGANWLKPEVAAGTACVVTFRIQRSGQVTDVRVETPSGLSFYDRAATRSVYSANPLPPLPPEFRGEELGVHIRFQ
jgi:TonB family protein